MNSPRPLVFDLDGTLIDSRGDIAAATNHTLQWMGRGQLPVDVISSHVGNGARRLIAGVLGEEAEKVNLAEVLAEFQSYYVQHPVEHNQMMPGAIAALELRSERPVALCTNKPRHLTAAVVRALDWEDSFDSLVAPKRGDPLKPDGEPLERVAEELRVEASRLIMIGDGPQDVGAGKAVGAHTIGVKGGFLPLARLIESKPDVILETLEELPRYLASLDAR